MNRNTILPVLLFVLFCLPDFIQSQTNNDHERPKIGLVLSGGGAKGIAHIGILKAMEEEGIRPDFITGTSMGSIIGGLYALGYSADQLDTIIRQIDWEQVLSNNIPLEFIAYEEKEYYNRYLIELPFEKGKLKLPTGVIQGQMLSEMLARFTWPSKNYSSFDDFPIPFRCIATDVSTGKEIIFSKGSLAKAMRASMAIPTAFTPVDLDTTLAVDGGVVNNFPVEELYKMGADIIIGVNVSHGFKSAYEIKTMTGILLQISMIPSSEKLEGQIEKCDIYISPDLKGYSTASFSSYNEILELGYKAGEKYRPELRHLAESEGIIADKLVNPPSLHPDSIYIGEISITGNHLVSSRLIVTKLQIEEGDKVSIYDIETGIKGIYGINHFEKVVYTLSPLPGDNLYRLTIKTTEKTPAILKGSIHYDNIFKVGILLNITLRNLVGKSSRTIVAGDISENPKLRIDYLKYIGLRQKIAVNFRYDYLNEKIPSYDAGLVKDIDISYEHNFTLNFLTTQSLRNSVLIGATYQLNKQKQKFSSIIPEGVKYGNFNYFSGNFLFMANTFNDRNYPTKGRELSVGLQTFFYNDYRIVYEKGVDTVYIPLDTNGVTIHLPFSEDNFNKLIVAPLTPDIYGMVKFSFTRFYRIHKKFQIVPLFSAGVTLSTDSLGLFQNFRIGGNQRVKYGDIRFIGLNYAETDYENYAIGGLFFQNVFFNNLYLKYGANLLLPYGHIPLNNLETFDINTLIKKNSMLGYGVELTYKSFLGPVSLGLSRNSRDSYFRYYLAIGFSFNYTD